MFRAIYHAAARLYYWWALNAIHPAHPDASYVALRYALHTSELDLFLRNGR